MKRYTLKTFCCEKQLEIFTHRTPAKLEDILRQTKFSATGEDGIVRADHVIIVDNQLERIFQGTPTDALLFVQAL